MLFTIAFNILCIGIITSHRLFEGLKRLVILWKCLGIFIDSLKCFRGNSVGASPQFKFVGNTFRFDWLELYLMQLIIIACPLCFRAARCLMNFWDSGCVIFTVHIPKCRWLLMLSLLCLFRVHYWRICQGCCCSWVVFSRWLTSARSSLIS